MQATGIHDLAFVDGTLYVVLGLGADPAVRTEVEADRQSQLGRLFSVDIETGEMTEVADISGYETSDNPDGAMVDSNPFALAALPDGNLAVVDAGGNDLLAVTPAGDISTLAVFPDTMQEMPDGSEVPSNAVPNSVAVGPDDHLYVGQLTGFPFPVGGAKVFVVPAAGGEPEVYAEGFTNTIDVAFGDDGSLYVLEWVTGGMLNIDPANPATLEGRIVHIAPDGTQSDVAGPGLIAPTGLAVGPDGALYVTMLGVLEDAGMVLRLEAPTGAAMATPTA